jgi:glycerophosphoryl diester phosphodiesterase
MKQFILMLMLIPHLGLSQTKYDLQGHRGARGVMPENSIAGMLKALDLGVNTLELDLAISKDGEVVVSHEPWMNPHICWTPAGEEISQNGQQFNLYQMDFQEIKKFDCGTKPHPSFPHQANFHVSKPLLKDLLSVVEKYVKDQNLPLPKYNIEIKSSIDGDNVFHPTPQVFSTIVYELIDKNLGWDRVNIQSFDFRILTYFHQNYPNVKLAVLVDKPVNFQAHLDELGFIPQIYSPYFPSLSKEIVEKLHAKGMIVIPWTVNSKEDMEKLLEIGVDGIISDYPNLAPYR